MKPSRFAYIAPQSADEAVAHLAAYDGEARLLSGGQSLVPMMNFRLAQPLALIDLNRCPGLDYIQREENTLVLGAMTRQAAVEQSPTVKACCPLISHTMGYLGSPTIRNRGTIGGTLAHADRTAELPAVAVALEAEMIAHGPGGSRTIAAADFFVDDLTTALQPDEMLREVRFPVSPGGSGAGFVEATNRHHDLALAGIAAFIGPGRDTTAHVVRVVAIGIGPRPVRFLAVEEAAKNGGFSEESLAEAAQLALEEAEPEGDTHATAEYRRAILPGLIARALRQATLKLDRPG